MILKLILIACENEHGNGEKIFPNIDAMDAHKICELAQSQLNVADVRRKARAVGWGRVNGGDFCPGCTEGM